MTPRDHSQSFDARRPRSSLSRRAAVLLLAGLAGATAASGQVLFPNPFVVEHQIVHTDPDGGVFADDPVTDYYAGSRIISVRPDDSRLVVDFAQRRITEIRPDRQTYAVLSFGRFVELRDRLRDLELGARVPEEDEAMTKARAETAEPEFGIEELPAAKTADSELISRPGVRRLRVALRQKSGDQGPAVDVWLDPGVRLAPAALDALERFENQVLGARDMEEVAFSRYIAAARKHAEGAFPIRTVRPTSTEGEVSEAGTVEDLALRLEPVTAVPQELLTVPQGYRRVVHALE
ncbi:MAG: hypothetical protein GY856_21380, partial [bacterium]|nr:hypothetical protein [bacterium]